MKIALIAGFACVVVVGVSLFFTFSNPPKADPAGPLSELGCVLARKAAHMREWQPIKGCGIGPQKYDPRIAGNA